MCNSKIQINFGSVCQNLLSATKHQRRLGLTKITDQQEQQKKKYFIQN